MIISASDRRYTSFDHPYQNCVLCLKKYPWENQPGYRFFSEANTHINIENWWCSHRTCGKSSYPLIVIFFYWNIMYWTRIVSNVCYIQSFIRLSIHTTPVPVWMYTEWSIIFFFAYICKFSCPRKISDIKNKLKNVWASKMCVRTYVRTYKICTFICMSLYEWHL